MANRDFLEEQRRRQRELVAVRRAKLDPDSAPPPSPPQPQAPMTATQKVSNFWYHYKFAVLAAIFISVVIAVTVSQCARREKFDFQVVLFSYNTYTSNQLDMLEQELEKHGTDVDGDGEVNIQVVDCSFSDSEMLDQQNAKRTKLTVTIASNNEALLYIVDAEAYDYLMNGANFEREFFVDLSLPEDGGRTLPLPTDFCDAVNAGEPLGIKLPEGLRIARRIADENTTIGQKEETKAIIKASDTLIQNLAK